MIVSASYNTNISTDDNDGSFIYSNVVTEPKGMPENILGTGNTTKIKTHKRKIMLIPTMCRLY